MSDNRLKIAYMGTPDFAVPALKAINDSIHDVMCVYTQPPRPKGRGKKVQPSPVHAYAEEHWIPVRTPETLKKNEAALAEFEALRADLAIVAAYGLILPKRILDAPKYGCLNIHASILPRWRGASPIQHAIWKGDEESGISIMQMDEGLDTGNVITDLMIPLEDDTTAESLHDELADISADMIVGVIDMIADIQERPHSNPQIEELSTYAPLLKKEDGKIDWNKSAQDIDRQIRALNPWPGVYTSAQEKRLKIKSAKPSDATTDKSPGTILDDDGNTACGEGTVLTLNTVQPDSAKPMDIKSAINGHYVGIGDILE